MTERPRTTVADLITMSKNWGDKDIPILFRTGDDGGETEIELDYVYCGTDGVRLRAVAPPVEPADDQTEDAPRDFPTLVADVLDVIDGAQRVVDNPNPGPSRLDGLAWQVQRLARQVAEIAQRGARLEDRLSPPVSRPMTGPPQVGPALFELRPGDRPQTLLIPRGRSTILSLAADSGCDALAVEIRIVSQQVSTSWSPT